MSGLFPKVCSLGVHRPGRAVRFVSVAECSNANSQYVAGSSPDVASKHLVFDTSRSMYCSTGFWLGLKGALLFCCIPFLLQMSANSPAMNSCALSCLTVSG